MTAKDQNANTYFGYFDILRMALAVAVLIGHLGYTGDLKISEFFGSYAVCVFFTLSGLVVGRMLDKLILENSSVVTLQKFYFGRIIRIWIPFALALAGFCILMLCRYGITTEFTETLPFAATYTYNLVHWTSGPNFIWHPFAHIWTLAVEEQFYLAAPVLYTLIRGKNRLNAGLLALLLITFALGYGFFGAILLGTLCRNAPEFFSRDNARFRIWLLPLGILLLTASAFLDLKAANNPVPSIASLLIIVGISRSWLGNPVTRHLGGMSYSFYLWHWAGVYAAQSVANRLHLEGSTKITATTIVALCIATLISYCTYTVLETRINAQRPLLFSKFWRFSSFSPVIAWALTAIGISLFLITHHP
jgi:peptidoglycan/LPS O-acetylase OafA/YrhL